MRRMFSAARARALDMLVRNRSSLRHRGSAPARPPRPSRHPWLRAEVGRSAPARRTLALSLPVEVPAKSRLDGSIFTSYVTNGAFAARASGQPTATAARSTIGAFARDANGRRSLSAVRSAERSHGWRERGGRQQERSPEGGATSGARWECRPVSGARKRGALG